MDGKYAIGDSSLSFPLKNCGDRLERHTTVSRRLFTVFCNFNALMTLVSLVMHLDMLLDPIDQMHTGLNIAQTTGNIRFLAEVQETCHFDFCVLVCLLCCLFLFSVADGCLFSVHAYTSPVPS